MCAVVMRPVAAAHAAIEARATAGKILRLP